MVKTFCDKCNKEINQNDSLHKFEVLRHISKNDGCFDGYAIIENGEFLNTSGVYDKFDLCLYCYNEVMGMAWLSFKSGNKTCNHNSIRKYRGKHNLKQVELAEIIGISQANLSQLENGTRKPCVKTEFKLRELGISLTHNTEET